MDAREALKLADENNKRNIPKDLYSVIINRIEIAAMCGKYEASLDYLTDEGGTVDLGMNPSNIKKKMFLSFDMHKKICDTFRDKGYIFRLSNMNEDHEFTAQILWRHY